MDEPSQSIALDCGIAYARLETWLVGELALPRHADGLWVFTCENADSGQECNGNACTIGLTPLENRTLGNVSLERTQLFVDGSSEAIAAFMKLFTLKFVSAGG